MLCYYGTGERKYAEAPIPLLSRLCWEFQAVLSGRIAMVTPEGPGFLRSRHLWLSSPEHRHGWTGEPRQASEVAVFHFLTIPETLARRIAKKQHIEISLTAAMVNQIRELAHDIAEHSQRPGPEMLLRHEHALLELSLLVYEASEKSNETLPHTASHRVQKALRWFDDHLEQDPSLDDVARATGTSSAHLRRHFHEVMQASPKKIFDQLRFQRALQLMADSGTKLSVVSEACGFESASSFSRAFKHKFGVSPQKWRA